MSELRLRHSYSANSGKNSTGEEKQSNIISYHQSHYLVQIWHWFVILAFNIAILLYLRRVDSTYPEALLIDSPLSNRQFTEGRARKCLEGLVAIGSKPAGSLENEKLAVDFILKEIDRIKVTARLDVHNFEVDLQSVSGSFSINFLSGFTSVYENVNNIIVRLTPKSWQQGNGNRDNSEHISVMVNCHYDTGINSSGASDDGVSCAIMLEVLRVLSISPNSLRYGVLMVFNGAEENILQASHGFITQHHWAKEIRAFVNLEAAGAGGRELLFQAGPEHPWLVRAYAANAPHPFASVFAQEVFDSGIIPSDTDFRIYRDFGSLPGLDVAYITNGYVYHTKYDQPDQIPTGCIQRGGENLLAVVRAIAESPYLSDPGEYRHGKLVYFDFVGLFMVVYTARIGCILNVACLIAVIVRLGRRFRSRAFGRLSYLKQVSCAFVVMISSLVLGAVAAIATGVILHKLERRMSWYGNPLLIVGLFCAPMFAVCLLGLYLARRLLCSANLFCGASGDQNNDDSKAKGKKEAVEMFQLGNAYFDCYLILLSIPLAILTYCNIGSAVLFMVAVAFPLISRSLFEIASPEMGSAKFLISHIIGLFVPCTFFLYASYSTFVMFIPIMGRSGTVAPPDIIVAGIAAIGFALCFLPHISLVILSSARSMKFMIILAVGLFLACFILVNLTSLGFPYRVEGPARQRHIIQHIERTFHATDGSVEQTDSGIFHLSLDHNGVDFLHEHIPALKTAETLTCNHTAPYCGIPFYFPVATLFDENSYIRTSKGPNIPTGAKPKVKLVEKTIIGPHKVRYLLEFSQGPSHMNIYLLPVLENVDLVGWSIDEGTPIPTQMPQAQNKSHISIPHYFIYYAYGTAPEKPFQLSIDLFVYRGNGLDNEDKEFDSIVTRGGLLKVAVGAHYISPSDGTNVTPELQRYMSAIPGWAVPIGWVATYESWII